MFSGCKKLLYLNLSSFNTSSVSNANNMFRDCSSLIYLNLGDLEINGELQKDHIFDNIFNNIKVCIEKPLLNFSHLKYVYNMEFNCSDECFGNKSNVVGSKKICVEKCEEDEYYKYEYNHVCMKKCPVGTHHKYEEEYLCQRDVKCKEFKINITECEKNLKTGYFIDSKDGIYKPCYKACKTCNAMGDIYNKNCIEYLMDLYLDKFHSQIDIFNRTDIDNGKDFIHYEDDITFTLTTTYNQKNNEYFNTSYIDLGQCEYNIRKKYNISENDTIYILKIDIFTPNCITSKVEYELFYPLNGKNLTSLNLSVCENVKIDIYYPVDLNLEDLQKYDAKSDFFNDICNTYTTENGLDKPLIDRRNELINDNKTICEEDCELENYDNKTKKAQCSCMIKIKLPILSEVKINKKKLLSNFVDINNIMNIKLLKCINLIFDIRNIFKNSANYLLVFLFILSVITISIFKFYNYIRFKKMIKKISNKRIQKHLSKNKNLINDKNKKNTNKNRRYETLLDSRKRKSVNIGILGQNNINNNESKKKKSNKSTKKETKKLSISREIDSKNKIIQILKTRKEIININSKVKENKYNDNELNLLSYKKAIKHDKRSYCQYYVSLLRTKNILIFTFCNNQDYNSRIIKIYIFFFIFQINFSISAMFYTEETMHKIYQDEGEFDIIYQIPKIIYSSLLSIVLTNLITYLGLFEVNILKIKNCKVERIKKVKKRELKNMKIKITFFFIITYILLFSFWIYVGCFCVVYKNTQIHLLTEVLSSFLLSFITPFAINLIPGIFRIPSLKKGTNRPILYKFSKILQIF